MGFIDALDSLNSLCGGQNVDGHFDRQGLMAIDKSDNVGFCYDKSPTYGSCKWFASQDGKSPGTQTTQPVVYKPVVSKVAPAVSNRKLNL